jgi:hypothetical protein
VKWRSFDSYGVVHCTVGLARYGIDASVFDFRPTENCFDTPNVLEHPLENCKTVECISQFATLFRVCDRQSP